MIGAARKVKGSMAHQELALRLPDPQFVVAIFVNFDDPQVGEGER